MSATSDERNQGVGLEVEGDGEGIDSESKSVLSERRSNLLDNHDFEYEMELARICLGENGEYCCGAGMCWGDVRVGRCISEQGELIGVRYCGSVCNIY